MTPGPMQIIIIIVLLMVLFGAGRIPAIMENVAKGIKSFKKGLNEEEAEIAKEKTETEDKKDA